MNREQRSGLLLFPALIIIGTETDVSAARQRMLRLRPGRGIRRVFMDNKVLRIGTVGRSSVMDVMQEAIRLTDGVQCTVVYSRRPDTGKAYAEKNGVAESCSDYEAFIHRGDVDVIYIASPNVCHTSQALAALRAGKHVLMEKPLTLNRRDTDLLYQTALENHVYIFEAITTLFMPNYTACRELLPFLGTVKHAAVCYGRYSSKYDDYKKGNIPSNLDPALKGGALNDMGIYCIHAATDLFGEPAEVSYSPVYGPNGADVEGTLLLTYPGQFICEIRTSKQRDLDCGIQVEGTNGSFSTSGTLHNVPAASANIGGREFSINRPSGENRMIHELARFRDAIMTEDTAFFMRMYFQSRIAAGVLEDAHRQMPW